MPTTPNDSGTTFATASDLARLEQKIDALAGHTALLVERHQFLTDLYADMMPIARLALGTATDTLADLERRGYMAYGHELLHLIDNIVSAYPPDAVHALADNVVDILDVVRRLTQPGILAMAEGAAGAVQDGDRTKPLGVLGMLRATTGDDDVRRGLAMALAALREVGRAAGSDGRGTEGQRRLNPLLGAKRNLRTGGRRPESGVPERGTSQGRPGASMRGVPSRPQEAPADAGARTSVAASAPARAQTPPVSVSGVELTTDGFLADPQSWTDEVARQMASALGLNDLTERHWVVLRFARADYLSTGASPNIRRLTTGSGVSTRELYQLFPKAPGKTAAMVAGIPKPVGCI